MLYYVLSKHTTFSPTQTARTIIRKEKRESFGNPKRLMMVAGKILTFAQCIAIANLALP
jgi:hypothetical protein